MLYFGQPLKKKENCFMNHYIIVKFTDKVIDKDSLYEEIKTLFLTAEKIEGIHKVTFYPSVIDLPNRYDLMIIMEMDRSALPLFDASSIHREWKARYAPLLASKTIFDCENPL